MSNPIIIDCEKLPDCDKVSNIEQGDGLEVEKIHKILSLCESCDNKKPELK